MTPPTIGRIVHYRLSEQDANEINRRRGHAVLHMKEHRDNATGTQIHVGNVLQPGEVLAAIVVRVFDDDLNVNLQVFLDGNDTYWATSRGHSAETKGCWFWPPRVDMTREGR